MQQLCEYTLGRIAYLFEVDSSDFETSEFVELRNLVCSRLQGLMCFAEVNHQG